ncbi:MAG: hypothetical protein KGO92_13510 [Bacteroidota bacterium]|nr:hypothetical protein [Bacteroidota bacterium]
MKGVLFLARLALICNGLFLVCLALQRTPTLIQVQDITSIIVILGWLLAPFVNLAAVIAWLVRRLQNKLVNFPVWLAVTNLFFLFLQIFVHFILPS